MLLPEAGDDYVNLPTGFLYAGAQCVISTLWSINDLSSALVMAKFHELWATGRGLAPAAALLKATHWLRDDILTKRQLELEVLPALLAHLQDRETREACEKEWQKQSESLPEEKPFLSPLHWAPFTANGVAFNL
jgi:CHAT domain-containing protein